jgi:hypothetical protein
MPNYSFENSENGEEFDLDMSNAEREQYLADNPHIQQVLNRMTLCDSIRIGVTKPPSDFQKYVLGKVKEKHPLGNVERRAGTLAREW